MLGDRAACLAIEQTQHQRLLAFHVSLRPDTANQSRIEADRVIEANHGRLDLRLAQARGLAAGDGDVLVMLGPGTGRAGICDAG